MTIAKRRQQLGLYAASLMLGLSAGPAMAQTDAPTAEIGTTLYAPVAPEAAMADFDHWLEWTGLTHPDISYTTDTEALRSGAEAVRAQLAGVETLRDAWAAMAVLNPIFDDAHTGLRLPERQFQAWVDRGGLAFPEQVIVRDGKAMLAASGAEIVAINDRPMADALGWLMPRLRGEDARIRERIASLRFALAWWTYAGAAERYTVEVELPDGSRETQIFDRAGASAAAPDAEPLFRIEIAGDTALLTIDSFVRDQQSEFDAFLAQAFARIADAGVETLIIDLRGNGGGAHDLSDLLMAYLTDQPHSPVSAVTARIVPANQQLIPGSTIGDVVHVPFAETVEPPSALANRFAGTSWIVIGPATYSQAIAFSATAQDLGIAQLAGTPTAGRANQTAQVQRLGLPQTGFTVQSPIYIFVRMSGDRSAGPLMPDLELDLEPGAGIAAIGAQLRQGTQ